MPVKLRLSKLTVYRLSLVAQWAAALAIAVAFFVTTIWQHSRAIADLCDSTVPYYDGPSSPDCVKSHSLVEVVGWANWIYAVVVSTFIVSIAVLIVTTMLYLLFVRATKASSYRRESYTSVMCYAAIIATVAFLLLAVPMVYIALTRGG
jgi:hypothetical protein